MAVLLMASLTTILYYSRKIVKEETLQYAAQTLEGMVQRIDNILLSVEQGTGNVYFNMLTHLDRPDMMDTYSRELVASNPYIAGCAIVFEPFFYKNRELFMSYYRRKYDAEAADGQQIVREASFGEGPYTSQAWYSEPMMTGRPCWLNPAEGMAEQMDPLITYCLPIYGKEGKQVGVIGVDVSLKLLTQIVLETKPSPNSYCTLLEHDGSYIVHPDSRKLRNENVFTQTKSEGVDPSVKKAAEAMLSGNTGYLPFRMDGIDYYVFYKPFKRVSVPGRYIDDMGWSAGVIYPEDDIFGEYNHLTYYVFSIAIGGMLMLLILSYMIIHRQLLPLRMLEHAATRIAEGRYDEPIPDTRQQDEIGCLQEHFQQMQTALANHRVELRQLLTTLRVQSEGLHIAYDQAKKADSVKIAFLHHMSDQMVRPSQAICMDVDALCRLDGSQEQELTHRLADDIDEQGKIITSLLNDLLKTSEEEIRKEVDDVV